MVRQETCLYEGVFVRVESKRMKRKEKENLSRWEHELPFIDVQTGPGLKKR